VTPDFYTAAVVNVPRKPRWGLALLCAPLGLLAVPIVAPVLWIIGGGWSSSDTVAIVLGGLGGMAAAVRSIRAKVTMTPRADGVDTISNNVLIRHDWAEFEDVRARGVGPLKWDELVFTSCRISPVPPRKTVTAQMERAMRLRGWDRRLPISLFIKDWRTGELGDYVMTLQRSRS
jgi:hypothetical protein